MQVVPGGSRHTARLALATFVVACVSLPVVVGQDRPSAAAPGEDQTPADNPDLEAACGIDIHIVLDESSSIHQAGVTDDVRNAFRAFVDALNNTGSRVAVSEFGTQARLPLPAPAQQAYTTVTDATIASIFEPYIASGYNPPPIGLNTQYTNWEDAMRVARFFLPRPSAAVPHLTLFITDGDPTAIINLSQVTDAEYTTKVPLDANEVRTGQNSDVALRPAIPNANGLKAQGSHILAVGVGAALSNASSLSRLVQISGPDIFPDTGAFDISTTDVYRQPDFSLLEDALRRAAFQLCAPSVNIAKVVDLNPDPAVDDFQPGEDWTMTAEVAPEPAAWVVPGDATGSTAVNTTGPDGFVNFQWTTPTPAPPTSTITVTEAVQDGFFNDPDATTCSFITPEEPDPAVLELTATDGGFNAAIPADAIVTCQMVNRVTPAPAIDIEKATNGADADDPPGPLIPVGEAVTWTYVVTNTGNVPLSGLTVVDDVLGPITCPATTIAPEDSVTCTATGMAEPGAYANNATATAVGAGETVDDEDPSHYTGAEPGIDIEKATNGDDADLAPGPFIPVGGDVTWTYVVTNTGDTALTGIAVTDDQGVVVTCPQTTLAVDEQMTCTAPVAVAEAGQYENLATVTGFGVTEPEVPVQDSDPSHYFGEDAGITLVKFVNGEDANEPTGPVVTVGDTVIWRFLVTNTGNVPLTWIVTDPDTPPPLCPRIILSPGSSTVCFAAGPAEAGQQTNTATVTGTAVDSGTTVTDDDPANYFGAAGAIEIEKLVNGDDADDPPGPLIPVGSGVDWTYEVTNTGNVTLSNIQVLDTKGVTVTCPETELPAGGTMTCTASGTAEADAYTNFGIVEGETPLGMIVTDFDPAHFFGGDPGIHVEKLTNGVENLDDPPGVLIPVGDPVTWTFIVTNTGNVPLDAVVLTDDQLGEVTCPQTTLAVGGEMTCTATGTAALGQYANTATVVGTDPGGDTVTDDDPSHYFGADRRLEITKFVNGDDANSSPGLDIPPGEPVTMTFVVTNPGNVPMMDVVVTDDQGLAVTFTGGDTNGDGALDPGEEWTFEADLGPATPGRFDNVGTVTGNDGLENEITDTDPAFAGTVAPPTPPATTPQEPTAPARRPSRLPRTGGDVLGLVLLGLALVAVGLALRRVVHARRHGVRRSGPPPAHRARAVRPS